MLPNDKITPIEIINNYNLIYSNMMPGKRSKGLSYFIRPQLGIKSYQIAGILSSFVYATTC